MHPFAGHHPCCCGVVVPDRRFGPVGATDFYHVKDFALHSLGGREFEKGWIGARHAYQ